MNSGVVRKEEGGEMVNDGDRNMGISGENVTQHGQVIRRYVSVLDFRINGKQRTTC